MCSFVVLSCCAKLALHVNISCCKARHKLLLNIMCAVVYQIRCTKQSWCCCAGHPSSVDALVKYDADTVITGSSDGIIRIINVLPNRMLGVLGGSEDLPIERLALSHNRATLASVSHESCLRLWDVSQLADDSEEEEEGAQEGAEEGAGVRHQVQHYMCI